MTSRASLCAIFLILTLMPGICYSQSDAKKPPASATDEKKPAAAEPQSTEPPKFFRLDFVLKELEGGKPESRRVYSTTISTENTPSTIHGGSRVPLPVQAGTSAQFQYADVGVNIECHAVRELPNQLALNVTAEVSNATPTESPSTLGMSQIRQTKWSANVVVPFRKATVIFSSDDSTEKLQLQLELTATPIPLNNSSN